jgi:hypothetical protein
MPLKCEVTLFPNLEKGGKGWKREFRKGWKPTNVLQSLCKLVTAWKAAEGGLLWGSQG